MSILSLVSLGNSADLMESLKVSDGFSNKSLSDSAEQKVTELRDFHNTHCAGRTIYILVQKIFNKQKCYEHYHAGFSLSLAQTES